LDIEFLTSYTKEHRLKVFDISLEVLKNGIDTFQFCWEGEGYYAVGRKLRHMCSYYNVPFIVNNNVKAALVFNADGVHLGPTDTCIIEAREVLPSSCSIGYTINSINQLRTDYYKNADYLGVGPMFKTTTNTNIFDGTVNINTLKCVVENTKKRIVAIGGVTAENAFEVKEKGVFKVAIIGDIYRSKDIQKTLQKIKSL